MKIPPRMTSITDNVGNEDEEGEERERDCGEKGF